MSDEASFLTPMPVLPTVSASSTMQVGRINVYNAASAALAPTLPAISSQPENTRVMVQKYDSSANAVVLTCAAGDSISGLWTTVTLTRQGEMIELAISGGRWHVVNHYLPTPAGQVLTDGSVATVTGKTLDGTHNTFLNIPVAALTQGAVRGYDPDGNPVNYAVVPMTDDEFASLPAKDPATVYITIPAT